MAGSVLNFGDNSGILGAEADRAKHVSKSSWPERSYVAQVRLEFMTFLPLTTQCCDDRPHFWQSYYDSFVDNTFGEGRILI